MYKGLKKEFRNYLHLLSQGKLFNNKSLFVGISAGKPYVEIQEYDYGNSSGKTSRGVTFYPNPETHCMTSKFFKAWDEYIKDDNNFTALIDLLAKQGGIYVTIWKNVIDTYRPRSGDREELFKLPIPVEPDISKDFFIEMVRNWQADSSPEYDNLKIGAPEVDENGNWVSIASDEKTTYQLTHNIVGNIVLNYIGSK
jgi:hypothetical protein